MQNMHPKLSLIEHFKDLPGPRVDRTKEPAWMGLLVIAIRALLCGGESFNNLEDFGCAEITLKFELKNQRRVLSFEMIDDVDPRTVVEFNFVRRL